MCSFSYGKVVGACWWSYLGEEVGHLVIKGQLTHGSLYGPSVSWVAKDLCMDLQSPKSPWSSRAWTLQDSPTAPPPPPTKARVFPDLPICQHVPMIIGVQSSHIIRDPIVYLHERPVWGQTDPSLQVFLPADPAAAPVGAREGRSNRGRRLGRRRGGSRSEGQPGRARANRSALRRRPITGRLARQICPAVRGGAAASPGAALHFWAASGSTGQGSVCPERGTGGRPSSCASPGTYLEA